MQQTISFYDETGRITGSISGSPESLAATRLMAPMPFVEGGYDGEEAYVDQGKVRARPRNPAMLSGTTLVDLPAPCTIVIDGVEYACNEPTADLEFAHPGVYRVVVRAWPHKDKEFDVENPA